jgi:hypothetical protein
MVVIKYALFTAIYMYNNKTIHPQKHSLQHAGGVMAPNMGTTATKSCTFMNQEECLTAMHKLKILSKE